MIITLYSFYLLELLIVGYLDVKTKKIKNFWSLINLVVAMMCFVLAPKFFPLGITSFIHPLIFFVIGFVLYWIKVMGAGDVKFITTFFFMIPHQSHSLFLDGLLYSTIVLGAALIAINAVKHFKFIISCIVIKNFSGLKILMGSKFSYAPVILLAWIYLGYHQFIKIGAVKLQ